MMKLLLLLSVGVQLLSAVVLAELRADGGYAGPVPRKCIPFRYKKKEGENDFEWFPEPGGADDLFEGCVSIDEYPPFQDNDVQTPVDQNTEQTKWCVFDYKGDDANTANAKNYNPEQEADDRNKAWGYCLDTNSGGETTPEPTASEATPEPTASEATPEPTASEATPEPTASEATPEPTTEPPVVSPGEDQADGGYAGAEPRKCVPFRYKKKKGQNDFDWFPSEPGKDELFQGCVSIDEYIPFGLPPFESDDDDVQDPTKPETNQSMWCVFDDAAENYNPENAAKGKSWGYCLSSSNVVEPTSEPTTSEATPEPTASEATPEPTASEATPEPTASETTPEPTAPETTPEPTTPTTTSPTISPTTPTTPNPTTSPFEAQGSGPGNPNDENEVNVAAIVVPIVLVVLIAIAAVWFVIARRKKQQFQEEALPVTKSDQSGGPQEGPMKRFSKAASSSFSNLKGSFTKASAEPLQEPATSVAASAEPVTVTTTAPVDTTTATTATTNDATTAATTTTAAASASAATPNAATTNDATTAAATASTTTTNDNTTAATTATDATNSTSPTNNLTSS